MDGPEIMLPINEHNFYSEVEEEKGKIVLIEFWAPWCTPCEIIRPLLIELANEYQEKLKVCRVNIEDHPSLADRFEIRGVPYLLLFKEGKVLHKLVGLISKSQLIEVIEETTSLT